MKNALLLHGISDNHTKNWFPWLERELTAKKYHVWTPDLPQSDKPNIQRYNKFIFPKWKFNKESILIGHSSGAVAILGILQDLPEDTVIDKALLVAGFTDNLNWDALDDLFIKQFDWDKIKKNAKKIVLIHSDNDPYVPLEHGQKLKKFLNAEFVVLPCQFHFSIPSAGERYKEFPELLPFI